MGPVIQKQTEQYEEVKTDSPQRVIKRTQTVVPEHVVGEHPQETYLTKKTIFRSYQIIWYMLGIIEVLLFFRVILLMLGASQMSGFVDLIYGLSFIFAAPFAGMFHSSIVGNSVIEWSTFFGMIVYYLLALGLIKLFQFVNPVEPGRVVKTVDSQV